MSKQGEIYYLDKIGEEGRIHAFNKPFSDPNCGLYLRDLGTIMSILPPAPARLLDLGVGSGWTSCFFALRGYEVVAQDIAKDMIALVEENKKKYQTENIQTLISDYEDMTFENEFDCAVFYDSLHHADDEYRAVKSVYKALKPGGMLITAEPGSGHANAPTSQRAIREFDVNEKNMPPRKIIKMSRSIGFRESKIFFRQCEPIPLTSKFSTPAILIVKRMILPIFLGRYMFSSHFVVLVK